MSAPVLGATHEPCCSAHRVAMTCERYRRTHFVEVRPCCSIDATALKIESEARFDALVAAGPIVDNAADRLWGPNGQPDDQPERPDGECGFCGGTGVVDDGDRLCPIGCWRAPCGTCHGAGGWQQHDGSITECPRGCATGERAA